MFYKYKVGWYNSYEDKEEKSEGIVFALDWGQATSHVVESYGKDNVFEVAIYELMHGNEADYCLSKEDIEYTFKEN